MKWDRDFIEKIHKIQQLSKEQKLFDSKRVDSNLFHFLESGKHEKDPPTLKELKKKFHIPRKDIAPFLNT